MMCVYVVYQARVFLCRKINFVGFCPKIKDAKMYHEQGKEGRFTCSFLHRCQLPKCIIQSSTSGPCQFWSPGRSWSLPVAPVRSRSLQVSPDRSGSLPVSPGSSWSHLVALGRSWSLLVSPGWYRSLLVVTGRSPSLLLALGRSWSLLVAPGRF
jgi:hypothetical protein